MKKIIFTGLIMLISCGFVIAADPPVTPSDLPATGQEPGYGGGSDGSTDAGTSDNGGGKPDSGH